LYTRLLFRVSYYCDEVETEFIYIAEQRFWLIFTYLICSMLNILSYKFRGKVIYKGMWILEITLFAPFIVEELAIIVVL
jgi:hypothetical protein